jgi:hypothetical protein
LLRARLQTELSLSQDLLVEGRVLTRRFRIVTAEGEFIVITPPPTSVIAREPILTSLKRFMLWKMAIAFVVAGERDQPDAHYAFAASHERAMGILRPIERGSVLRFGYDRVMFPEDVEPELFDLLPPKQGCLSRAEIDELRTTFRWQGPLPTVVLSRSVAIVL